MRYVGNLLIESSPSQVWGSLIDPEQMSQCMPGLTRWRTVEPEKVFLLYVTWGEESVQPIQIPIRIEWLEKTAARHLHLSATATVGHSYQIEASGDVTLTAVVAGTDLAFSAEVTTPNKMMDRLVHTAVPKITAAFLQCLKAKLTPADSSHRS